MLPIKLTRQDLQRLRRELIALGVSVILAVVYFFGSDYLQKNLQQTLSATQASEQEATRQLGLVQQELADLQTYLPRYRALTESHILGDEQRLDWIEALESTQSSLHIPGLAYDFESQHPLALPPGMILTQHKLRTSPMKLELYTLHEEQLLNALDTIQKKVVGLPLLRNCVMTPIGRGNARTTTLCNYDWITLTINDRGGIEAVQQ